MGIQTGSKRTGWRECPNIHIASHTHAASTFAWDESLPCVCKHIPDRAALSKLYTVSKWANRHARQAIQSILNYSTDIKNSA